MNQLEQTIYQNVVTLLSYDSSGHNIDHIMRVYHMAKEIAKNTKANLEIIGIASLLHDVDDPKLDHVKSEESNNAYQILKNIGLEPEKISHILRIIGEVSYSKQKSGVKTTSIEANIVQDADRLDAIGAIGIARTFAYGGANNRSLFDGNDSSLAHFHDKLLRLVDLMHTYYAKQIAKKRHEFMVMYLKQLQDELNMTKG